jgi:hypothetical protein
MIAMQIALNSSKGASRAVISDAVKVAELVTDKVSQFRWLAVNKNLRIV